LRGVLIIWTNPAAGRINMKADVLKEMIVMRHAPIGLKRKTLPYFQPVVFLLLLSFFALGGTLMVNRAEKPSPGPTLEEAVMASVAAAAKHTAYALEIEESGPGYSLLFTGQAEGNKIYGEVRDFNLQVFAVGQKYFVRGGKLIVQWQEVREAGLESLTVFVRNPQELLGLLLNGKNMVAEEGPRRDVAGVPCKTYFLEIMPGDLQTLSLFSGDATLEKLHAYLWFGEDDGFLYKMALLMDIVVDGEKGQVNRVFTLNPRQQKMPEDLPQTDQRTLEV